MYHGIVICTMLSQQKHTKISVAEHQCLFLGPISCLSGLAGVCSVFLPQEPSRASTEEPIWSAAEGRWQSQHPSSSLCQEVTHITSVHIPLAKAGHLFMPNFNKEGNTTNLVLGRKKMGLQVSSPNDRLVLLPEKPALCPVLG